MKSEPKTQEILKKEEKGTDNKKKADNEDDDDESEDDELFPINDTKTEPPDQTKE